MGLGVGQIVAGLNQGGEPLLTYKSEDTHFGKCDLPSVASGMRIFGLGREKGPELQLTHGGVNWRSQDHCFKW